MLCFYSENTLDFNFFAKLLLNTQNTCAIIAPNFHTDNIFDRFSTLLRIADVLQIF